MSTENINGIYTGFVPINSESAYAHKTSKSPEKFEFKKSDLYLKDLQLKFQEAQFSMGTGFDLNNISDLDRRGKKNVMIDSTMLELMAEDPNMRQKYEEKFKNMFNNFDNLFESVGGNSSSLTSWGTFLDGEGLFNSWGVGSDPFSDVMSYFTSLDSTIMNAFVKYEELRFEDRFGSLLEQLKYEQGLEQLENQVKHMDDVNPHIISKADEQKGNPYENETKLAENEDGHEVDIRE